MKRDGHKNILQNFFIFQGELCKSGNMENAVWQNICYALWCTSWNMRILFIIFPRDLMNKFLAFFANE